MDVTINTLHCTVPESIRKQTSMRIERLMRLNPDAQGATANFSSEGSLRRLEGRVPVRGRPPLIGQGEGATFRTALDRAVERIERQLKRRNDRNRNRRESGPRTAAITA